MQEQFIIKSQIEIEPQRQILGIIIGQGYIGYAISSIDNRLADLCWFGTKQNATEDFNELLNLRPYLKEQFFKTKVCIDNNTNFLLPSENNNGDYQAAFYLTGAHQYDTVLQDEIKGLSVTNVFMVSYHLYDVVKNMLPQAKWLHSKTVLINNLPENGNDGAILINVSNHTFNIVASKENRLLIAQTYHYENPADVLFYLLKICETFDLKQNKVAVSIFGLIDKDSSLYNEVYQYFLNVDFKEATWQTLDNTLYPPHLFTILNLFS